jgi:diacylglycerol kinase family enzyme
MVTAPSHHTFHRLKRLLTTFLAQMWHVSDPVEHDDGRSNNTFVSGQQWQGQRVEKSIAKYSTGSRLHCKKAYVIINPRAGHNFSKISDVLAILAAAGWKTDIAVKHYAGHAIELATRAAEQDYDLVIAYGGDGTINHVVNGVMAAKGKGRRKAIGVIPGGTANQWASETSVPVDPVKAALALIESNVHTVDIGRLQVQEILFPDQTQENQQQQQNGQKEQKSRAKKPSSREKYFLLTAGLGIDALVISHTSKAMKQRVGPLAFDLAVAESLPEQHAFPIEVSIVEDGQDQPIVWSGKAYQVILGNTRRYANAVELTPDVYLDDGKLELCVITTGNTITTLQQMSSLLFRHKTDAVTAKHFLATHYLITLPASIHIHLDGSPVQLKDYLSKPDREALRREQHREHVMVTYRFDAIPHALRMAIPRTYDNTLFEHAGRLIESYTATQQRMETGTPDQGDKLHEKLQIEPTNLVNLLMEHGYKVKLTGVATMLDKRHTIILAGSTVDQRTSETRPIAVRIDEDTLVLSHTGEFLPHVHVEKVRDGAVVIAQGKKDKRGVIKAKHIMLLDS